jgi:hypothetical protein
MRITFVHVCDHAMLSKEGKLSVIGIFNRIGLVSLDNPFYGFFIAFEIEVNYAEVGHGFPTRIDLVDDRGGKVLSASAEIKVEGAGKPGDNPRFSQIIPVRNLKFTRAGPHHLNIWLNGVLQEPQQLTIQVVEHGDQQPQGAS